MTRLTLAALIAVTACSDPGVDLGADDGFGSDYEIVTDIDPERNHNVDVLFVIDNSGSMAEEQSSLTASMEADVFGVFEDSFGVRPNMHVGVISTDTGAGPFNISGCSGNGDDGVLQDDARGVGCSPPDDPYIIDTLPEDAGPRVVNYTGAIHETFNCIAPLGIDGCGFEQPLESMRRALDGHNPENAGFLRDDAMLAIVILADEDDCSTKNTQMFDTSQNSIDDPLGPLSSFRCFEFGVQCEEDDPRTPGIRKNCVPRLESEYMTPVSEYVDFVKGLKSDPTQIIVTAITGPNSPVVVSRDQNGNPQLDPSCESPGLGSAAPAVRLSGFVAGFRGRGITASICTNGIGPEMRYASSVIAGSATGSACLLGTLADVDDMTAGLQYDCRVYDAENRGATDELRTRMPACADADGVLPCFDIAIDSTQCGHTETQHEVAVTRDAGDLLDTHVLVRCLIP